MSNEITTIESEFKRFELEQRRAKALVSSVFFPASLKTGDGLANAVIVYELANRMQISPFEVAQSVFVIHNKPSFETKFLVARLNQSGKIKGRLLTIMSDDKQEAHCEAIDASTGKNLIGATISLEIAKREGWLDKNGSKWQTMPELMLRYRAQSFFINEFFPEVKFGMKTSEEVIDTEIVSARHFSGGTSYGEMAEQETQELDLNAVATAENESENTQEAIIEAEPMNEATAEPKTKIKVQLKGARGELLKLLRDEWRYNEIITNAFMSEVANTTQMAQALLDDRDLLSMKLRPYLQTQTNA